jgi:hypothetical protein
MFKRHPYGSLLGWDECSYIVFKYICLVRYVLKLQKETTTYVSFAKFPKWVITNNNGVLQRSEILPFQVKSE